MAATAVDADITTVEGLSVDGEPTDVQQSFVDAGGVQCGFCTPGLIVAVHHLLDRNPNPNVLLIMDAYCGNMCRCTGSGRMFAAVQQARDQHG
ncbi:MAG: (2Fe-2S)-binding protein, partial [Actinomycetota bacterium]